MNEKEEKELLDLLGQEPTEEEKAIVAREKFEKEVKDVWGYSSLGLEAKRAAMTMLSTKTGMYARIPLICKASGCPYKDTCSLLEYNLAPEGEYCPVETAQIELRYAAYQEDFNLDRSSFTDKNLLSEIINYDIMIDRCKALIAKEGVPVVDVVAGVAENGQEFYRPEVSKHLDAHDKLVRRRNDIYQLMMATRRDKKSLGNNDEQSLSDVLSNLKNVNFVIDEKPEHIE